MKLLFVTRGKRQERYIDEAFVSCGIGSVLYGGHSFEYIIKANAPDAVFSVCFIPGLSDVCSAMGITYISWLIDSPDMSVFTKEITNSCNRVFISDYLLYEKVRGLGLDNVYFMLPGFSEELYDCGICSEHKYTANDRAMYEKLERGLDENTFGYVNGLVRAQLEAPERDIIYAGMSGEVLEALKRAYEVPNPYCSGNLRYIYSEYIIRRHMIYEEEKLIKKTVKTVKALSDGAAPINVLSFEHTAERFISCAGNGRHVLTDGCGMQGMQGMQGIDDSSYYQVYHGRAELSMELAEIQIRSDAAEAEKFRKEHAYTGRIIKIMNTCL